MVSEAPSRGGRFFRRREFWIPTWRSWLLFLAVAGAAIWLGLPGAYSFLAVTRRVPTDVLVVEGWGNDDVLAAAKAEFERGGYSRLLVTGGLIDEGSYLIAYRTFAESGAATLTKMGFDTNFLTAVPGPPIKRDRTYSCAVALRQWLHRAGPPPAGLNVVTAGTHARRSRLLFQKALGSETEIGIIAVPDPTYDPRRWWTTSQGFRDVIDEWVAYAYGRLMFRPPMPAQGK